MTAISETYGEILPEGMQKLLQVADLTERDRFIDLGSGLGKIVFQTFLNTAVQAAIGIELNAKLYQQALLAKENIAAEAGLVNARRKLEFINGDFLTQSFQEATVALLASPCFGPALLNTLGRRLDETSTIRAVMSLRPLPALRRLKFKKIIRIECSWDTALCYVYQ